MSSVRWAFNFSSWKPNKAEWLLCLSGIQVEEKERICKFMFQKDAKASIAGRLMMRKIISDIYGISWKDVQLQRTDKGKPYHCNSTSKITLSFNVSHQGDWTILAAESNGSHIGADIMKIESPANKKTQEFFRIMKRQFTQEEWLQIFSGDTEQKQLANFYRNWCLKESFVKALGTGITYDLQSLSFKTKEELNENSINSTELFVDGKKETKWTFQEVLLDHQHVVATALDNSHDVSVDFTKLVAKDLINSIEQITPIDEVAAENFCKKLDNPWS